MQLGPQLEGLIEAKEGTRLRRIDIDSWKSEVAREHQVRQLPMLVLYDGLEHVSSDAREILQLLSEP